jgi:dethiobiotin synthetase
MTAHEPAPAANAVARGAFVAGTDTGIGKTRLVAGLLHALRNAGWSAIGMKPVASGTIATDHGTINEDVASIEANSSPKGLADTPRSDINPYCFDPPVSPHIAAEQAGIFVDIDVIVAAYERLAGTHDAVLVEGTGGWMAPIGPRATMADVAVALGLPVILVVGLRLGCLSHALLTSAAIEHSGARLLGWVGNLIDPSMQALSENLETLKQRLPAPPLGLLARTPDAAHDADALGEAAQFLMSNFRAAR